MTSILLVAPEYNYGRATDGYRYEYYNFYNSLLRVGNDVVLFDFMYLAKQIGVARMNRRLLEVANATHPDILLAVPHEHELSLRMLREFSENTDITTVSWFSDDHWRFDSHTRLLAPAFNWSITTASSALPKYAAMGYSNVLKSQWACNHFADWPVPGAPAYDVTFIGQPHGSRRSSIAALRTAGIDVQVWGRGWAHGRLSHDEMLRVFSQSRINLNLSNSSPQPNFVTRVLDLLWRAAAAEPLDPRTRHLLQESITRAERVLRPILPRDARDPDAHGAPDQIKGRNVEVPGCAGFLLTGMADDLEHYYVPGREVGTFATTRQMIGAIRHYLRRDDERAAVAAAGYERTRREHTYVHRFAQILRTLGFKTADLGDMLAGRLPPGRGIEIA